MLPTFVAVVNDLDLRITLFCSLPIPHLLFYLNSLWNVTAYLITVFFSHLILAVTIGYAKVVILIVSIILHPYCMR